jgi:hypothetical protein
MCHCRNYYSISSFLSNNISRLAAFATTAASCNCPSRSVDPFPMAGYSGTPLAQKLGIKPSSSVIVINEPRDYRKWLGKAAREVRFSHRLKNGSGFVHFFTTQRSELQDQLKKLRGGIADTGIVWVSWPKKSAGVATDVTEDVIRAVALPLGFVDVKVCAVNETWSGLKLMIRRENRRSS